MTETFDARGVTAFVKHDIDSGVHAGTESFIRVEQVHLDPQEAVFRRFRRLGGNARH
jgi:hypothetical protein